MPISSASMPRRPSAKTAASKSSSRSRSHRGGHLSDSDSDLSDDFELGSPPPGKPTHSATPLARTASGRPARAATMKLKAPGMEPLPGDSPSDSDLSQPDPDATDDTDDEIVSHAPPTVASLCRRTTAKSHYTAEADSAATISSDDDWEDQDGRDPLISPAAVPPLHINANGGEESESDQDVMDIDPRLATSSSASDSGLDTSIAAKSSAKPAAAKPSIFIDLAPKPKSSLSRSNTAPARPSTAKPPSPSTTSSARKPASRAASTPSATTRRRTAAAAVVDSDSDSDSDPDSYFESATLQLSNDVQQMDLSDSDSDFESSKSKKAQAKPKPKPQPKAPAKRKSNNPPHATTQGALKRARLSDESASPVVVEVGPEVTAPAAAPVPGLAPGGMLQRSASASGPSKVLGGATRSLGVGLSRAPLKPLGGGLTRTSSGNAGIGGGGGGLASRSIGGLGMRLTAPLPRPASEARLARSESNSSSKSDSSDNGIGHRSALLELESIANAVSPAAIKPFKPPTFKKAQTGALAQHNPTLNRALGMRAGVKPPARPLHDPDVEGALVLWRPPELTEAEKMRLKEDDKQVAVVVDPTLSRVLRPHQIDGVAFMYQCVTGLKVPGVFGCIMADEMGLGKTLQCITLLWTLLRQSPSPGKPTVEKAIIVCPSSLVRNWANELIKWLGHNAIHPLCADNKGSKDENTKALQQFVSAKGRAIINPILIISYESLRLYSATLGQTPIGLMLCDEGHRLKNAGSQTFQALNALNVPRRVILTGTPIQNDLTEYFSLLAFACPGMLGTESEFRKNFELPINRGRDADASDKERELSDQKLQELVAMASKVQIRRTQDLLRKYLPTKQEHVVFCKMADEQLAMYRRYLESSEVKALLRGKDSQPLKAIGYLKKLVNHPCLVDETRDLRVHESGKLLVLDRMLHKIKTTTRDKIVLISNYTQTLDVFEKLCGARGWGYLRLDGTMNVKKRQKLVDSFNDPAGQEFIFLLSSKAGGCGINLIGANRLVLFDPDWNPASDMQALARVWRDGQKKECFIYRFIATGTIEEKIFQRQCHKQMLSNCVVDEEQDVERHFSLENLRMLFQYNAATLSDTHDTFKCKRCVNNRQFRPPPRDNVSARNAATDMSLWHHYSEVEHNKVPDPMLRECGKDIVTFVFHNETQ